MSKKSKRAKLTRPVKQLQQRSSVLPQTYEQLVTRAHETRQQILRGDFAGGISTGEPLLDSLPKSSPIRIELLALLGMAHGMLKHYQQSYDIFSEAISLDPTNAELWYNRGLACHFMARPAEAVRDLERAVELSKDDTDSQAAVLLEISREELREAMQAHEPDITFEKYMERELIFTQTMNLMQENKWPEAEQMLRQLTETGSRVSSYWGNLGVCLMMQGRYDEAEEALKQALAINPDYPIARDNLKKLPKLRRGAKPYGIKLINMAREEEPKQLLSFYEKTPEGEVLSRTVIEKVGHAMTGTWKQLGKQAPRYDFFLNTDQDTPITTCPRCGAKTQPHKFFLVINVNPAYTTIVDKLCRHCDACDLLIVNQDRLEKQLAKNLMTNNPKAIGNDYLVIGTVDRTEWYPEQPDPSSFEELVEYLHDFKEVVTL